MSDPTRLVDGPGDEATALERELLRAGKQQRLAPRDKDRIWTGLSAQLLPPITPGGHGPGVGTAAKAAVGAKALGAGAVLKGTILAVALGGGSLAGYRALGRHSASTTASTTAASPALARTTAGKATPPEPTRPPDVASPVERARLRGPSLSPEPEALPTHRAPASRLAAEGRLVLEARQELRDGRPEEALRRLEAARAEFADGMLVQEREALTVEALARAGRRAEASRRAQAFLRAHPESPHAADVRGFAAP